MVLGGGYYKGTGAKKLWWNSGTAAFYQWGTSPYPCKNHCRGIVVFQDFSQLSSLKNPVTEDAQEWTLILLHTQHIFFHSGCQYGCQTMPSSQLEGSGWFCGAWYYLCCCIISRENAKVMWGSSRNHLIEFLAIPGTSLNHLWIFPRSDILV